MLLDVEEPTFNVFPVTFHGLIQLRSLQSLPHWLLFLISRVCMDKLFPQSHRTWTHVCRLPLGRGRLAMTASFPKRAPGKNLALNPLVGRVLSVGFSAI
jgi:hypothetical protein